MDIWAQILVPTELEKHALVNNFTLSKIKDIFDPTNKNGCISGEDRLSVESSRSFQTS